MTFKQCPFFLAAFVTYFPCLATEALAQDSPSYQVNASIPPSSELTPYAIDGCKVKILGAQFELSDSAAQYLGQDAYGNYVFSLVINAVETEFSKFAGVSTSVTAGKTPNFSMTVSYATGPMLVDVGYPCLDELTPVRVSLVVPPSLFLTNSGALAFSVSSNAKVKNLVCINTGMAPQNLTAGQSFATVAGACPVGQATSQP